MKQFFVSNDFKPVYYDGTQGEILCPIAFASQVHIQEILHLQLKGIRCKGLNIVCETRNQLTMTIVTDEDEPQQYLSTQLEFLHDLLLMRFGLAHTKNSSTYFAGGSGALSGLQKAVQSYLSLCSEQQSFMMHAMEWLDPGDAIATPLRKVLQELLKRVTKGLHALLIIDSKVIMYERGAGATPLSASEMLMLVVLCRTALDTGSQSDLPFHPALSQLPKILSTVHLKPDYSPNVVCFATVAPQIHLIFVAGPPDGPKSPNPTMKVEDATLAQTTVYKTLIPYADFLLTKNMRHLSMHAFIEDIPGLVHFVLVDRTHHKVVAPEIDPLCGTSLPMETRTRQQSMLREKVKLMLMTLIDKGVKSDTCSLRTADFLYYFRRWCEDDKGIEVVGDSPTIRVYRKCELFVLFIGSLPTAAAEQHAQKLIGILRERDN